MKQQRISRLLGLLLLVGGIVLPCEAEVRVWQEKIGLPTYALGEEDPNPPFPVVTRQRVYPYTMLEDLTDRREAGWDGANKPTTVNGTANANRHATPKRA